MIRRPPRSTLCPCTPLFRSEQGAAAHLGRRTGGAAGHGPPPARNGSTSTLGARPRDGRQHARSATGGRAGVEHPGHDLLVVRRVGLVGDAGAGAPEVFLPGAELVLLPAGEEIGRASWRERV